MENERMRLGALFLATAWEECALKVVKMAVQVYELTPEQGEALEKAFVERIQYSVEAT
jgi:hypothetical protein